MSCKATSDSGLPSALLTGDGYAGVVSRVWREIGVSGSVVTCDGGEIEIAAGSCTISSAK